MFAKCKQIGGALISNTAESMADMFYEIGKQAQLKLDYEAAVKWLERGCDMLAEQDLPMLSLEASELRLCIIQGLGESRSMLSMTAFDTIHSSSAYQARYS